MKTLVLGATGQLGQEMMALLPEGDTAGAGSADLNILDRDAVMRRLEADRPELVINCAAYNLVDQAEDEPEVAYRVNALGPRNVAQACESIGSTLIHVSSDYVFGLDKKRSRPYIEADAPGPEGAYAVSKLTGEYYVRSNCSRHFVVRTCGLYGAKAAGTKGNFIRTMIRLGRERDHLRVVSDQQCTPTYTHDLAVALKDLAQTAQYGLYHCTNRGDMSWFELASFVFECVGIEIEVEPISTAEFGARAARPGYSVLDCGRLDAAIGKSQPEWRDAVERYLREESHIS